MSFSYEALGITIHKLRKRRKVTQEVLSGFADIGRSHLSALERGQAASVDTYYKIACALEIPLSELFRLAEEEMEKEN